MFMAFNTCLYYWLNFGSAFGSLLNLKILTTISHQFPGEEEAVLPEFHDNHTIWCCWDDDFFFHNISRYATFPSTKFDSQQMFVLWFILDFSDIDYYVSAAIAIFSKMSIGTLDVSDFLGKPSLLFHMIHTL